ncbi:hypothetical protein [Nonomuraea sp. NEAU-A123]|uniref:hypothetical protein n=1 Tax=Nonomuraea sp. NEAU-A123 TaxID=2839649 RepID=UPI001BE4B501|nr:hypothetical protein [Nonomuraea sp. NEAU-A123]MBT2226279.1 hypothetical protein [Nonomuraea sp. NEAU-A123]
MIEQYVADYRIREMATALQWSREQGQVMAHAHEIGLYLDERGYHLPARRQGRGRQINLRSGRGRQVKRARVEALIAGGFLVLEGSRVALTNDGYDAVMAWSLNVDTSVEVELDELPPLSGGEEAARRYAAYEARIAEFEARLATWRAENEVRLAEAERVEAERQAARLADFSARRFHSTWDAIYAVDEPRNYGDDDLGDVITTAGPAPWDVDEPVEAVDQVAGPAELLEAAQTLAAWGVPAARVLTQRTAARPRPLAHLGARRGRRRGAPASPWSRAYAPMSPTSTPHAARSHRPQPKEGVRTPLQCLLT